MGVCSLCGEEGLALPSSGGAGRSLGLNIRDLSGGMIGCRWESAWSVFIVHI